MNKQNNKTLDTQQVEIIGRNLLISLLTSDGIEVALPARDKGIDLIAYTDINHVGKFSAIPIQLKAASNKSFSINRKYSKIPNLLMAYVWDVHDPLNSNTYIMTYEQAVEIASSQNYTRTPGYIANGVWVSNKPSRNLLIELEKYRYYPGRLASILDAI